MRKAFALAGLLCLTATGVYAAAQNSMYRWVDKDGNVHFSDQVPADIQAKLLKPDNTGPAPLSDEELAAAKAREQARMEKCEALKKQLDSYKKAGTISESDALGNIHEYSDDDKKKLVEQTQAKSDEACAAATASATP